MIDFLIMLRTSKGFNEVLNKYVIYPAVYLFVPIFNVIDDMSGESNTVFDQNVKCF